MELDKIIYAVGKRTETLADIAKSFSEKPSNYKLLKEYAKYFSDDENAQKAYYRSFKKSQPAVIQENMDLMQKDSEEGLAGLVEGEFESLINSDYAQIVAPSLEGISRQEREIKASLSKGSVDGIKKLYIELYGQNKAVKHFAEEVADKEFFHYFYPKAIADRRISFLSKFAGEPDSKGKVERLKGYIFEKLDGIKPENKRKAYLEIGKSIYHILEDVKKAEEKKDSEKKDKKD